MKKLTTKLLLRMTACAALFVFLFYAGASAQFNPPAAYEDTYPTTPNIGLTSHTSAFSFSGANVPPYGAVDLVLAGWDDVNPAQPAGVSWRLLQMMTPSVVFAQGVIPYVNVRDLEVGWVDAGGDPEIVVAYYLNGVGHMLDVYSLSTGTPVLLYTNTLSTMTTYTRISIDSHIPPYAVGVAWQDAGGINTVVGLTAGMGVINFSNILTLTGTLGETSVDLAFVHTSSGLMLQCVYYNPSTGNMTESAFDFWTAMGTPGTTIAPIVNDINFVGKCKAGSGGGGNPGAAAAPPAPTRLCPYPNIDAPGHYNVDNWAYTYTTNNADISVRLMDLNTSAVASTVIVNNGSVWGGLAINANVNRFPFCYYNRMNCMNTGIVIAWHTTAIDPMTGTTAGYVGLNMNENGTALLSAPDYLTVANNPTWASPTPVLSISKQDDQLQYMYTVFPEVDLSGNFQLENKYPPFCVNSFKGGAQPHSEFSCTDGSKIAAFAGGVSFPQINVFPNPSKTSFNLTMPAAYQESDVTVIVTNILGVVAGRFDGPANNANAWLNEASKHLVAGTYLVDVSIKGKIRECKKVMKVE